MTDEVRLELAAAIKAARTVSLSKMAEAAGIPKQTLVRLEAGEPTLTVGRARALARSTERALTDVFAKPIARDVLTRGGATNKVGREAQFAVDEVPLEHVIVVLRALRVTGLMDDERMFMALGTLVNDTPNKP